MRNEGSGIELREAAPAFGPGTVCAGQTALSPLPPNCAPLTHPAGRILEQEKTDATEKNNCFFFAIFVFLCG